MHPRLVYALFPSWWLEESCELLTWMFFRMSDKSYIAIQNHTCLHSIRTLSRTLMGARKSKQLPGAWCGLFGLLTASVFENILYLCVFPRCKSESCEHFRDRLRAFLFGWNSHQEPNSPHLPETTIRTWLHLNFVQCSDNVFHFKSHCVNKGLIYKAC